MTTAMLHAIFNVVVSMGTPRLEMLFTACRMFWVTVNVSLNEAAMRSCHQIAPPSFIHRIRTQPSQLYNSVHRLLYTTVYMRKDPSENTVVRLPLIDPLCYVVQGQQKLKAQHSHIVSCRAQSSLRRKVGLQFLRTRQQKHKRRVNKIRSGTKRY